MDPTEAPPSTFRAAAEDPEFWKEYFRLPKHDLAESVIELRRLRGITQAELASRMGTHQPAIARIEAARSNVGLDTIRKLSVALDAVVQISMRPAETCVLAYLDRATAAALTSGQPVLTRGAMQGEIDFKVVRSGTLLESEETREVLTANNNFALSA
jgi:transcriptional regulator with XRE-family HTH domain